MMPSAYTSIGAERNSAERRVSLRSVAFGVEFRLQIQSKTDRSATGRWPRGRWPLVKIVFTFVTRVLSTIRHRPDRRWRHFRSHSDLTTITSINSVEPTPTRTPRDPILPPKGRRRQKSPSPTQRQTGPDGQQPLAVAWLEDRAVKIPTVPPVEKRQSVIGDRKESEVSHSATESDDLSDPKRRRNTTAIPYGVLKASWAAKTLTVALVLLFLAIAVFFWYF